MTIQVHQSEYEDLAKKALLLIEGKLGEVLHEVWDFENPHAGSREFVLQDLISNVRIFKAIHNPRLPSGLIFECQCSVLFLTENNTQWSFHPNATFSFSRIFYWQRCKDGKDRATYLLAPLNLYSDKQLKAIDELYHYDPKL